ncbi:ATP-binding protein [Streptomyces sp. NBC_01275]|uniref:ATP-binding protein n=1 Tax=Streptomyces sp. NBC_01275 TaxID=2903807 RepID=UPI0022543D85|nr:ATP-binding protein [Streptomyces sp. NBC_01275]MCX4765555.1 ATP-binding protein [Streptomyces sp. NBC_01275]
MTSKPGDASRVAQPARPTGYLITPCALLDHTFEMRFTSTPRGARLARRLAAHRLDAWGIPYDTYAHDGIVLVLAELASNAVRHGHVPGRDFHLRLQVMAHSRTVRIEVADTRAERLPPRPDALRLPDAEDSGGRGLLLVAGLAARWDWHLRSDGPGKTVWAECALTPPK